jgi:vancomycin resistance protein YoaR
MVYPTLIASIIAALICFGAEQYTLSAYSTTVQDQTEDVRRNIRKACERLNGTIVLPGQTFSFNGIIGEASIKNGYAMGRVMYQDSVRNEPGGGICQVSSTLYNAMLLAGFVIAERHRHYQPVSYVPIGLDATIKFGRKDLRMRNSHSAAVRISAASGDLSLTVSLQSDVKLNCDYSIQTEADENHTTTHINARGGISVHVYRIKSGCGSDESQFLYKDFYPPVSK